MKLRTSAAVSLAIARSPPGALLSRPINVWQLGQDWANTAWPRLTCALRRWPCPVQPAKAARTTAAAVTRLAHVAGVAKRVPARLRPDAEAVRPCADRDAREELAGAGGHRIDDAVVPATQPEDGAIGGDAAHVGTAAAG